MKISYAVTVCNEHEELDRLLLILIKSIRKDFASFKNNLKDNCSGDYIFQIDADEYLDPEFLQYLPDIILSNPEVELFWVPRINTVEGITPEHISKWRWRVDEKNRINFPDYQSRLLKNSSYIKWENKVHEIVKGYKVETKLPDFDTFCLIHPKTIAKQEKQNQLYSNI